ncbi:hypothetical protein J2Z60_001826 [Lactobacillus colini]|uniref:Uncharacterized protein n=1 Tax=Lactobacillus colini TaxID=1819254 RepID=A0ABS4MG45_9LACO|nr:hypothetical protein [Lactobacillus colini]MBP2058638.1 hypothetical protein [Lactobacillus colini]
MYKVFIEMFSVLLTVGGVGMINYIIAEQLDAVDTTQQGSSREKALAIIFSMLDLVLYLAVESMLKLWLSGSLLTLVTMLVTILGSVLFTVVFAKKINNIFYKMINKIRGNTGQSFRSSKTVWQDVFDLHGHKYQRVFLYDFDHKPQGFGWRRGISNDKYSKYSITIQPGFDDVQPQYDDLIKEIQTEEFQDKYDVLQFCNFEQKFIAIVATLKD